jgi:hypothetical protein
MDAPSMIVTEIWVSAVISVGATKQVVNRLQENWLNSRRYRESTFKALLSSMAAKWPVVLLCQIQQD